MTIFVVFRVSDPDQLGSAIQDLYKDDNLSLGNNEWLISSQDTAQGVATKLGISKEGGKFGEFIVFSMDGYYGRTGPAVWEWIKVKMEWSGG